LTFGPTLLLPAFAAAFLGSTQLQPGRFNVWGTLIAIYVLATGVQGLQLVSGQQWLSDMFNGVALIVAVGLAVNRQRRITGDKPGPPPESPVHADIQTLDGRPPNEEAALPA
jgi:ribose transport system permease protein